MLRNLHVPDVCKFVFGFGFRRLGVAWRHVWVRCSERTTAAFMPEDSTSLIQEVGALTADIPEAALWLLVHAREPPKACRPTLGSEAEAGAQEQRSKQTDQESARRIQS